MNLTVAAMTEEDARRVISWRYEPPYDLYNVSGDDAAETIALFTDPANRYFGISDDGTLIAFCCYGEEARVLGGDYSVDALDVGWGMRPDLTGRGLGPAVIEEALRFGAEEYGASRLRATIASFNERSLRASRKAGFIPVSTFARPSDGMEFVILVSSRDARQ